MCRTDNSVKRRKRRKNCFRALKSVFPKKSVDAAAVISPTFVAHSATMRNSVSASIPISSSSNAESEAKTAANMEMKMDQAEVHLEEKGLCLL